MAFSAIEGACRGSARVRQLRTSTRVGPNAGLPRSLSEILDECSIPAAVISNQGDVPSQSPSTRPYWPIDLPTSQRANFDPPESR